MRCFRSLRRKQKFEFFDSRKKAQDVRREEVGAWAGPQGIVYAEKTTSELKKDRTFLTLF